MIDKVQSSAGEGNFLYDIFNHILLISRGECEITEKELMQLESNEEKRNILAGLKLLHEDLEHYKRQYKSKLDAEYRIKLLQKKNENLEQFNFMASHDLKEPLRNINNYSQLLVKNISKYESEKIEDYLKIIHNASERMYNLLNSILEYTTAGKKLDIKRIQPNKIIEEIKQDLKIQLLSEENYLLIDQLPDIVADESSMRIVFQNLIMNAIKFRDKSRELKIEITCKQDHKSIIFCVKDNGIGIEAEDSAAVFDMLKKLHNSTKFEGSGIGLSTCKRLVEIHGGKIWVESEYGKGSEFYIKLPITPNIELSKAS